MHILTSGVNMAPDVIYGQLMSTLIAKTSMAIRAISRWISDMVSVLRGFLPAAGMAMCHDRSNAKHELRGGEPGKIGDND